MSDRSQQISEAATAAARFLGYTELKPEQMRVVTSVVMGHDVFVTLPTGYGKSLCFAILPLVFDAVMPMQDPSIVLVLSPLTAIMKDQVSLRG